MKPKTMILAFVAVVCGLGAMWMTNRLLAEKSKDGPQAEPKEKVLVAKGKIASQTVFKDVDKYFEEKEIVGSAIPKGALRSADKIQGKRLSRNLAEGDYITVESLVSPESDGLGAVLPPGMRAVSIRVQPDSQVAGFVLPRSHVDIMCTVRNGEGTSTYTILENMEVLAVDTKAVRGSDDPTAVVANTVTLAASPDDCNLLKMAAGTGVLDLSLRSIGDNKFSKPKHSTQKQLDHPRPSGEASETEDTGLAHNTQTGVPNTLPAIPQGVAPTTPPAPVEEPKKEPELERHVMRIQIGPTIERVVFTKKPGEEWPVESTPSNRAAPQEDSKTNTPAAPAAGSAKRNPFGG